MLVAGAMKWSALISGESDEERAEKWGCLEKNDKKEGEAQAKRFGGGEHKIGGGSSRESRRGVWRSKE